MKKKYYVENLGCAHCAMSMEEAVRKIDGVIRFQIHFAQNKMILEAEDENFSQIFEEVEKTCRSFETDVRFREKEIAIQGIDRKALVKILSSAVLFAFALLVRSRLSPLLSAIFFLPAFLITGYGVLAKAYNGLRNRRLFDENFLMALASVGAFLIGEYAEGVAVMLLYAIGEFFQDMAVSKSRRNIADLMDIRPDHANLITDGKVSAVSPEDVPTGSLILVKPGEKIPLDGIITEGNSVLDTSSLTGESLPREVAEGERVISGCVNLNGVLTVRTEKSFEDSSVSKILALIEDDEGNRSKTERIITRFARIYTPIVVLLAFILAFLPPLFLGDFPFWIHKAITCLVISCPCALVISVPLSFFGAIGGASSRGILIKGADCLEKLANASVVAFDKTGTLTKGVFTVSALHSSRISEEDLLQIAATCEHFSDHPIALSLKKACPHEIDPSMVKNVSEIAGEGVEALVLGNTFFVGNAALMKRHGIEIPPCEKEHFYGTVVHVATKKEYLGHIIISDEVREDAEETLKFLRQRGINVQLLSGDTEEGVLAIAKKLDVGKIHNSLLPQEKRNLIAHLKENRSENESIVFVGDGTNDAPVLAKADVGIAMGGIGSDAAIEAADVVLMDDKTFKVVLAIDTAKKAIAIVWQNILLSVGTKLLVLIPTIFNGKESIPIWLAIFADVGVCLLAILNATRTLTVPHHDEDCHCGGNHEHHHEHSHKHHHHDEDCHCGEHHEHHHEDCHCGEHHEHHHHDEACHCGEHHHKDHHEHSHK